MDSSKNQPVQILEMYSLYDKTVGQYLVPFFVPNVHEAKRYMIRALENDSPVKRFVDEYDLYAMGSYKSDGTGVFTNPQHVCPLNVLLQKE